MVSSPPVGPVLVPAAHLQELIFGQASLMVACFPIHLAPMEPERIPHQRVPMEQPQEIYPQDQTHLEISFQMMTSSCKYLTKNQAFLV
jgi:hypothetical protein